MNYSLVDATDRSMTQSANPPDFAASLLSEPQFEALRDKWFNLRETHPALVHDATLPIFNKDIINHLYQIATYMNRFQHYYDESRSQVALLGRLVSETATAVLQKMFRVRHVMNAYGTPHTTAEQIKSIRNQMRNTGSPAERVEGRATWASLRHLNRMSIPALHAMTENFTNAQKPIAYMHLARVVRFLNNRPDINNYIADRLPAPPAPTRPSSTIPAGGCVVGIQSVHTGKSLNVSGGGTANGTNVQMWGEHISGHNAWRIVPGADGTVGIQSVHTGKSLNVSGGHNANGTNVQLWGEGISGHNAWRIVPVPDV